MSQGDSKMKYDVALDGLERDVAHCAAGFNCCSMHFLSLRKNCARLGIDSFCIQKTISLCLRTFSVRSLVSQSISQPIK